MKIYLSWLLSLPFASTWALDNVVLSNKINPIFQGAEDGMSNAELLKFINYIAYDIVANFIVFIGIVSNMLNLIVLTRPKLKGKQ